MTEKQQPNLARIVVVDIFRVGLLPFLLMISIFITAMLIVFSTHDTRRAVSDKDAVLVERERLNSEWRNLILEENALAEHSRVQEMAIRELEMKRPDGDKEVVVFSQ